MLLVSIILKLFCIDVYQGIGITIELFELDCISLYDSRVINPFPHTLFHMSKIFIFIMYVTLAMSDLGQGDMGVHPKGTNVMAVSGLGCTRALVGTALFGIIIQVQTV